MKTENMDNIENGQARRLVIAGVTLLVLGLLAIAFPLVTTLAVEILVGGLLLAAGVLIGYQAMFEADWKAKVGMALLGLIYLAGGIAFLLNPLGGAVALTAMLGAVFLVDGVCRCVLAFWLQSAKLWIVALLSGCVSTVLGVLVLVGLSNGASLAFIGLLVGLNFMLSGSALLVLGWHARKPEPTAHRPATQP